jgi:hypothetical protein
MAVGNNTCFLTCPLYYFGNTLMVCQKCSPSCLRCFNSSNCTQCQPPAFLGYSVAACLQCPLGFYGNTTYQACEPCR